MKLKRIIASILAICMVLSAMGTVTFASETVETWDGTADTSWYDAAATEVTIETAEQLAGLAELVSGDVTFNGVTITLAKDLDLYCEDTTDAADGDPLTFRPIGDHSKEGTFEGTFDGAGHTINNLYQNGWDLGYEWGAYGSYGLFGNVNNATIKNLNITGSESYIEGGDVSCIAGSATGTCLFENIVIEDSVAATYNNGCGTIIGWSGEGDYTFNNITIAETVTLAGLWGSFDSSIGGVVGQAEPGASYTFNNVDVACRLDAYNDVTASYDYYNYRMSGMLIGRLEETTTVDGANYPDPSKYTIACNDVNVTFGEWANYHYCRAEGARGVRVEAGYAYDGIAVDYNHSACTVHHMECIPFTALFGGDQFGVKGADEKVLAKLDGTEDIVSGLEVTDLAYKARTAVELYMPENVARAAQLILVDTFGSLEEALAFIGTAEGEYIFKVIKDIEESVEIKQNPDQKITLTGDAVNKPVISGTIKINGGSARYATAALTIENIVFDASGASGDSSVKAAWDNNSRYTSNVTISNCDFVDKTASKEIAAIKQGTGGCHNWLVKDCTATGMHSLIQVANIEKDFVVEDCVITDCSNGINLNNTAEFTMTGTTINADGYGIRAGASNASTTPIDITLENNTINAGADESDDAAIVLRPGAGAASVNITSGIYLSGNGRDAVYSEASTAAVAISGGSYSSDVSDYVVEGFAAESTANGIYKVEEEDKVVDEIMVEFVAASETEGKKVYNINLKAEDDDIINRLNSVDLTFALEQVEGENDFEIIASNEEVAINAVDNSKVRYEFHYNGKSNVTTDTNTTITIGQVMFTGYGKFSFAVDASADTNAAHATKLFDNIVDTFVPGGVLEDGTAVGEFDVTDDTIKDIVIAVPDRNLTITVDFPNAVVDQVKAYQDMKVVISGGDLAENITIDLGTDAVATDLDIFGKADAAFVAAMDNGSYVINVTDALTVNNAYTVTVSGAGYRTARYTVTMTEDKTLRFWNNVMDEAQFVEIGKDSSKVNVTFLAGDIVKDNKINIYDLSAVVSYFGTTNDTDAYSDYAKYDLNRDGLIDSKDVAYVLVSWGN